MIGRKVGAYSPGWDQRQRPTRASSAEINEREEAPSIGLMKALMKGTSEMEFKVGMECFTVKKVKRNMKGPGMMGSLTEKEFNILTMEKDMKVPLSMTNFMEKEFSISWIQSFMAPGMRINFLLSTWSKLFSMTSDSIFHLFSVSIYL